MSSEESTTWAEDRRLELVLHKALNDVSSQSKKLTGKNKQSLQDGMVGIYFSDWDEMEVAWLEYFSEWGK